MGMLATFEKEMFNNYIIENESVLADNYEWSVQNIYFSRMSDHPENLFLGT